MTRIESRLFLVAIVASVSAATAEARSGGSDELSHFLSNGYGIAAPSPGLALYENPTGLTYNLGAKAQLSVIGADNFDPALPGAHLLLGNGSVGGAVGYRHGPADSTDGHSLEYGLAATMDSVNLALGIAGALTFNDNTSASDLNVGLLYNPNGKTTFGMTAFGILDGVGSYGAGLAFDLSSNASFALDTRTDADFEGWSLKPGLGIHLTELQLNVGYGFNVTDRGGPGGDGVSVGLGFKIGNSVYFTAYLEQISKYFASLQFRL